MGNALIVLLIIHQVPSQPLVLRHGQQWLAAYLVENIRFILLRPYEWQTCGDTDFDTQLTLYPSGSCSGASLAYNDDFCGLQSSISWTATFTGTVRVLVSKYSCVAQSSCMTLQWQCTGCTGGGPPNDNCTGAQAVTCGSVISSTTVGANSDVAPTCGTGDGTGGGVWYSIIGTGSDITASLCTGTAYDSKIRVYTGSCGGLTCVTGNDDFCGLQSEVTWTSTSGTTYYILVHGFSSSEGAFDLTITCISGGQPNQYCVDAVDICGPTTLTGSTDGALNQPGIDPAVTLWACNAVYDNYVFYTFTTDPAGSTVVLDMTFNCGGSNLQTAIFDVPPLPCDNANLWSNSLFCIESTSSPYTINATGLLPNTLYYIIIDQWPGSPCNFTMNISGNGGCYVCPSDPGGTAEQDCINAVPICEYQYCQQNSYSGAGADPNEINSANSCLLSGEVNDVWYTLTVVSGGQLSFVIVPNNGTDDYDWAVYNLTTANCSDIFSTPSLEVSCNFSADAGPTGPNGLCGSCTDPCVVSAGAGDCQYSPTIPVNAGETYAINVSNWSGSTAGYVLDFSASTAVIFDNVAPTISSLVSTPSCGITSITFNLSENVLCSSVQACDFTVTGPQGTTVTGISGVACGIGTQENIFTITLSPALTTGGSYNLNLVTGCGSVEDLCGNVALAGTLPFTITTVSVTTSQTNVSCFGSCNGSATAFPSGGTPGYTYSWSNGCTSQTCTGLCAGTHTVTVTDASGCTASTTVNITQPPAITLSTSSTATSCTGACDGTVLASASGGAGGFSYCWTGGLGCGASKSNVCAGTYTVTVTDANGCTASASVVVANGPVVTAGFTYNGNQCLSGNSYAFTNTGTSGCSYAWNFGDAMGTSAFQNPTYSYAACGSFTVTQTVTCGACSDATSIVVTVFCQPSITSITGTDITCNGACNGAANLTQTGGTSFSWTGPGGFTASTEDISGLCLSGTYNVTVTNVNGCTAASSVFINQPSVLGASITSQTNVLCNGDATGSVTVAGSGGAGGYTYSLNGGPFQGSGTFSGLTAGSYTVTVKDANGCTVTQPVTITQPSPLTASITSQTNVLCTGDATGSVTVAGSGGAGGYTYSIGGPFQGSGTFTGLLAGSYTVTVQDANGCQASTSVTITQPPVLNVSIPTSTDITCNGLCDGSATSTVTGGTGPYTYSWNSTPVQTTPSATGLCAGTYILTVTDANSCIETASVLISEPPVLSATVSGNNPGCAGVCNGEAWQPLASCTVTV